MKKVTNCFLLDLQLPIRSERLRLSEFLSDSVNSEEEFSKD